MSFSVAMGLIAWMVGGPVSAAETPSWPRIISNPATTLRELNAEEAAGPASEEIWISSGNPIEAVAEGSDAETPQAGPSSQPEGKPETPSPSNKHERPSLANTILRFRTSISPSPELTPLAEASAQADSEGSDEALFRTTSTPVNPAGSVFRPESRTHPGDIVPATQQAEQTALRVPSGPTAEPDGQRPLGAGSLFGDAQNGTAERELKVPSVVRSERPAGPESATERLTGPEGTFQPRPAIADTQPVTTARPGGVRHVTLRVRLAELNRSAARKWALMDFGFGRSQLLDSLLKAETGRGAIVLDSVDLDEIESELDTLRHRGVVQIRSQPTLVTASGRPAKFAASSGAGGSVAGSERQTSAAGGDLNTDVTLLPVVTDEDHVQLEVAYVPSGSPAEASHAAKPGSASRPSTTRLQMRAGQTVVIGGLRSDSTQGDQEEHQSAIERLLGIGKTSPKPTEFVVLVTPELVPTSAPHTTATRVRGIHDAARSDEPESWPTDRLAGRWSLSGLAAGLKKPAAAESGNRSEQPGR